MSTHALAAKIPAGSTAIAVFGLFLIAGAWAYTIDRVRDDVAEATSAEFSKNANLALALDVQTNQLLKGVDRFLLLIKQQYEQPAPRIAIRDLSSPDVWGARGFTFFGVADERGNIIESAQAFTATNVSDRELFKVHQRSDTRALLISPPILGRVSGRWAFTLTRRINKPDGSFGGVVGISVEPSYLTELFENTTLGPLDVMSLVLDDGTTLARRRGTQIEFGDNIAKSQLIAEHAAHSSGNFIGPGGVDGNLRVFSYRRMKDYPVIVTVGTAETDAFGPIRARARRNYLTAAFASAGIAMVCALGIVMLARQQRSNLRLAEQASLLDKAQDAIVVTGLDRRVTYWNKSAERLYGWTAEEANGRALTGLFHQKSVAAQLEKAFDQAVSTGEWMGELQPVNKSARRVVTESRWTLVRDAAGRPRSILTINTDVTERRQLEQQFLRAQRLESIGKLAGGIAHDLNNVLTPIMLSIEMLRERIRDTDGRQVLDTIGASAKRGADMVAQVLSFARGLEGRGIEIPVKDLVADVERIARDTLPKTIEIRTQVNDGLPPLLGDPTQFHQVLLNLCVNARDAMPDGGLLTLSAHLATVNSHSSRTVAHLKPGQYVVLEVEDTGTGIPHEIAEKIFDPFFTTKDPGKGTGLGLSTSLTIVKSHGGHLDADSQPGYGARFSIHLPASRGAAAPGPIKETAAPAHSGAGTVLVVDDEPAIRDIAQRILESAGYRVMLAVNGQDAVDVVKAHPGIIAAVVLDMTMPVMQGVPAITAIAAIDPSLPIVAVSGVRANEEAARKASRQVRQFLPKPFTSKTLLAAVQQVLADEHPDRRDAAATGRT